MTKKRENSDKEAGRQDEIPPAGAHAKPHLTDDHKTPGTGVLPDKEEAEVEGPTG